MYKLFLADIKNLLRIKWLWLYFCAIALGTLLFLYMSQDLSKVVLSLLNVTLLIVPLITAFFGITYLYDSRNFIQFLLSQPLGRSQIFFGKFLSLSLFMTLLYVLGVTLPLLKEILSAENRVPVLLLTLSGAFLSLIFTSIAFLIGILFDDKAKGVSFLLGVWLYLSILHDGLILTIVYVFKDYPLEKVVLLLTLLSPVDLARLLVVLNLDIAALMGLSGAIFKEFFSSTVGFFVTFLTLSLWFLIPTVLSLFFFKRKDF